MKYDRSGSSRSSPARLIRVHGIWIAIGALTAGPAAVNVASAQVLEEVITTAQRREADLQTTAVAVSAFTGETLAENEIFSVNDLAQSTPAFSLTALSPLDLEVNIRGITNTRLDSPTADPSVGLFVDEVYVGRTGALNTDFYDLERIEVIRGPQGVLLGKNVVGGALSVITAKPQFESSGKLTVGVGNYASQLASGYVTGGLSDRWAGRMSFQTRNHEGYSRDVLNNRDLDDLESIQGRAQLLYESKESELSARFSVDYTRDRTNGISMVAVPTATGTRPWSNARAYVGITDPRKSAPNNVQYKGAQFSENQFLERDAYGLTVNVDKGLGSMVLSSVTGYRNGEARSLYDQTGIGLDIVPDLAAYQAMVAARPGTAVLFNEPVQEHEDISQLSQELRLTSNYENSRVDWIAGLYYQHDEIDKFDKFAGEAVAAPLASLSGESQWRNSGELDSYAVFAQVGYSFTDAVKLSVGARYTRDEKSGTVSGLAVETGDRFNPNDTVALTPLQGSFAEGTGFVTDYGDEWSKVTPQAILSWEASDNLFTYVSVASGFKGGGFEDTPANAVGARIAFDPENATNYEVGVKSDLLDNRMRLNVSAFYMKYQDLQVQQTNQDCLCNITDNASDARIQGVEVELQYLPIDALMLWASGSYLDTEYVDFLESSGVDSSGNELQRTPDYQYSAGFEYSMSLGQLTDALKLRASYSYQAEMFWQPANVNREDAYGLLDATIALAPSNAQWRVAVWGKNLTDELYRINIIPFFGDEVSQFGMPRTYGVDFSWKF